MAATVHCIDAGWPAPPQVVAFSTTRPGGHSKGVYRGLNLGHHVGDEPSAVAANRQLLGAKIPLSAGIPWLSQVHGTRVVEAGPVYPQADASWSRTPDQVCAVLTADCLPVLFCDRAATVVAAAHAGWRGLLDGVLEATVAEMSAAPGDLLAWLGPAIGPEKFEVGGEVRAAFLAAASVGQMPETAACFIPSPGRAGRYMADLYGLARVRLKALAVHRVFGGEFCTFSDPERFYSYRRDGQTGRMASVIYLRPGSPPT